MTANAIDEWILNAIPPGSGRYYAILHAHPAAQPRLRLIATLASIWSKLCFSNREIEVAQKKMQWWHEELNRATHLHPVTRELQQLSGGETINPALRSQLLEIHQGYGSLLTNGSPATEQANQEFHRATGAVTCSVFCYPDPNKTPLNTDQILKAGILLSRLRCLRYLHMHINNGLMCLPMAELEARDIKPNQFIPGALAPNTAEYLDESLRNLQQDIEQCLQQLISCESIVPEQDGIKSVYIYLQLQARLLKAMQKNTSQLFQPQVRLSPLRNYWIALRAAARFENAGNKG